MILFNFREILGDRKFLCDGLSIFDKFLILAKEQLIDYEKRIFTPEAGFVVFVDLLIDAVFGYFLESCSAGTYFPLGWSFSNR